jgi:hypothetical protein
MKYDGKFKLHNPPQKSSHIEPTILKDLNLLKSIKVVSKCGCFSPNPTHMFRLFRHNIYSMYNVLGGRAQHDPRFFIIWLLISRLQQIRHWQLVSESLTTLNPLVFVMSMRRFRNRSGMTGRGFCACLSLGV